MIRETAIYPIKIYSMECVLLAAQELKEFGSIVLSACGDELAIEFTIDEAKILPETFLYRFNQALCDASLRVSIGDKTSAIRQMIVAQAFAPCDNLGEIVEAFENHDR